MRGGAAADARLGKISAVRGRLAELDQRRGSELLEQLLEIMEIARATAPGTPCAARSPLRHIRRTTAKRHFLRQIYKFSRTTESSAWAAAIAHGRFRHCNNEGSRRSGRVRSQPDLLRRKGDLFSHSLDASWDDFPFRSPAHARSPLRAQVSREGVPIR